MNNWIKKLNKKQKQIILGAGAIIVLGGGISGIVYQTHVSQVKAEAQQIKEDKYQSLSKSIDKLVDGDYLAEGVNLKQIESLKAKLTKAKKQLSDDDYQTLNRRLNGIESKLALQNKVNALFKAPALTGKNKTSQVIQDNLTDQTVDAIQLDTLTKGDFKTALESLKSDAKTQIKKVADDKAKAEKEKAEADAKAKQEAESNAQAQAAAQAEAQQQATEQANAQAQQASQQASAGTSTTGGQTYSGGTQAQGGTTSQAQAPSTSGNGGYTYHTPTQDELNQSEKEASEDDYSSFYK